MAALSDLVLRVFVYGIDPLGDQGNDTYLETESGEALLTQSGEFIEIAIAGTWLVLGDPVRGRLGTVYGNKLGTVDQAEARADITSWVETLSTRTGKQRSLDSYDPGRVTLTLDAKDRRFDPFSTVGTAYSPTTLGQQRNLFRRGCKMRVALVSPDLPETPQFWVWSGFVDTIQPEYSGAPLSPWTRTVVTGVDGFDMLGRTNLAAVNIQGTGETVGSRIRRICARAGWIVVSSTGVETTAKRFTVGDPLLGRLGAVYGNALSPATFTAVVATTTNGISGYGLLGGEGAVPLTGTTMAQPSLTDIKLAIEAEGGQVWVNRAGQIQWTTRADQGPYPPGVRVRGPGS